MCMDLSHSVRVREKVRILYHSRPAHLQVCSITGKKQFFASRTPYHIEWASELKYVYNNLENTMKYERMWCRENLKAMEIPILTYPSCIHMIRVVSIGTVPTIDSCVSWLSDKCTNWKLWCKNQMECDFGTDWVYTIIPHARWMLDNYRYLSAC